MGVIFHCTQVPIRKWENAQPFLQGTFPASHSCRRTLEGQEGRRKGGRCRGAASPPLMEHPAVYRGRLQLLCLVPAEVFKSSYHEQLMEFAFNSEKQGLTNLMQNVMSRPAWLLLVTPIFFTCLSSHWEQLVSVMPVVLQALQRLLLPKKHSHFSLLWPFISYPGLPPALSWHLHSRGSCVKATNQLLG